MVKPAARASASPVPQVRSSMARHVSARTTHVAPSVVRAPTEAARPQAGAVPRTGCARMDPASPATSAAQRNAPAVTEAAWQPMPAAPRTGFAVMEVALLLAPAVPRTGCARTEVAPHQGPAAPRTLFALMAAASQTDAALRLVALMASARRLMALVRTRICAEVNLALESAVPQIQQNPGQRTSAAKLDVVG